MKEDKLIYKSIFISDIHLGSPVSRTDELLAFLEKAKCENLYIVGDFIDFYHLYEHHGWSDSCNLIVRKIFSKIRKGTKVKLCVGNHDAFMGVLNGFKFGNVEIGKYFIHSNKFTDYLVLHGDNFDKSMRWTNCVKILSFMHSHFHWLPLIKRIKWISDQIASRNMNYDMMVEYITERNCSGCIFGHTHVLEVPKTRYPLLNCGDWVEHCSAIVETLDGEMCVRIMKNETEKSTL